MIVTVYFYVKCSRCGKKYWTALPECPREPEYQRVILENYSICGECTLKVREKWLKEVKRSE